VFDEDRYFDPGEQTCVIEVAGRRVGVLLCEDMWRAQDVTAERRYPVEPAIETARGGADVLAVLNGSPFVMGKWSRHIEQLRDAARAVKRPIVSVNQVGANDDLIFDGRSVVLDSGGNLKRVMRGWSDAVEVIDLDEALRAGRTIPNGGVDPMDELFNALALGVRDYCRKTGHSRCFVGLSGGIDSALTCVIAAAAIGPGNVTGVLMPSQYTAGISNDDAEALAKNLGLGAVERIPIAALHDAARAALKPALGASLDGVADENAQARLRGIILMALTNARGGLVLATGNKSELAAGYCTLYGDMNGALAVLGDVVKTRVYDLARWVNANTAACGFAIPPIPQRSITRVPTAELRPNQTDQDTLPPYEALDQIISRLVELEQSIDQIIAETNLDAGLVRKWAAIIDREQYKREQAAVVLKVTGRTFGRGRPMPIAMRTP
jgi:NAD+ synthase (glutamine-hydrolysing)